MLFTTHLCVGAVLGRHLSPATAFAAAFVSHLALDRVPHWGNDDPAAFLRAAKVDGLTALAVSALLLARSPRERRVATLAGMAGAGLPDMDKPGRHFFGMSPFPGAFDRFHAAIQAGRENPGNIWTDVVTGVTAAAAAHSRASATSRLTARAYFLR